MSHEETGKVEMLQQMATNLRRLVTNRCKFTQTARLGSAVAVEVSGKVGGRRRVAVVLN